MSKKNWNIEDISEQANNWNLACDASLLEVLKHFGGNVLSRAENVYKNLDNLHDNLENLSLSVDLIGNEFNSLRNNQFVECRVYEDDETLQTETEQKEKAESYQPINGTIEDYKEVVSLGLGILNKYYSSVAVPVSDSEDEDEDEGLSYVFRRKDPYDNRPLPYMIGTEKWYKKWHVGLQDSSDSENEKTPSEKFVDSDDEGSFKNNVQSDLTNSSALKHHIENDSYSSTHSTSSDSGHVHDSRSSILTEKNVPVISPMLPHVNFADQLTAKLGDVLRQNDEILEVNRRPIQKYQNNFKTFSNEPPPFHSDILVNDESHGIFSSDNDEITPSKDWGSSLSKSRNFNEAEKLFEDVDEDSDSDIFSPRKKSDEIVQPYLQSKKKQEFPIFFEDPPLFDNKKDTEKNNPKLKQEKIIEEIKKSTNFKKQAQDIKKLDMNTNQKKDPNKPSVNNDSEVIKSLYPYNDDIFDGDLGLSKNIEADSRSISKKLEKPKIIEKNDLFDEIDESYETKNRNISLFNESDDIDIFNVKKDNGSKLFDKKLDLEKTEQISTINKKIEHKTKSLFDDFDDQNDDIFNLFSGIKKDQKKQKNYDEEISSKNVKTDVQIDNNINKTVKNNNKDEKVQKIDSTKSNLNTSIYFANANLLDCVPPAFNECDNMFDDTEIDIDDTKFETESIATPFDEPFASEENVPKIQDSYVPQSGIFCDDDNNTDQELFNKDITNNIEKIEEEKNCDNGNEDSIPNNISMIAEKLQQIPNQNNDLPKSIIIPSKLQHNLKINVDALLPRSTPPVLNKIQERQENSVVDYSKMPSTPSFDSDREIVRKEIRLEKSISFDNSTNIEVLKSVTKNRAGVPMKRKPSTRKARQKSLVSTPINTTMADVKIENFIEPIPKIEEFKEKILDSKIIQVPLFDDIFENIPKNPEITKQEITNKPEKPSILRKKIDNLFDSSDESDDFSKSNVVASKKVPNTNSVLQKNKKPELKNLFNSSDDDDDVFGFMESKKVKEKIIEKPRNFSKNQQSLFNDEIENISSHTSGNVTKSDFQPNTLNKKTSKSSKLVSLEGDEDPLFAMLK